MPTQSEKAALFRALHEKTGAFLIPNPWEAGAAISGLIDAAREVKDHGTFGYLDQTLSTPDLNGFMRP